MQIEWSKRGLGSELVWGAEKDRTGSAFLTTSVNLVGMYRLAVGGTFPGGLEGSI